MKVTNEFISGACNSVYKGLDWIKDKNNKFDEVLAYACNNQILLYSPLHKKVMVSLNSH